MLLSYKRLSDDEGTALLRLTPPVIYLPQVHSPDARLVVRCSHRTLGLHPSLNPLLIHLADCGYGGVIAYVSMSLTTDNLSTVRWCHLQVNAIGVIASSLTDDRH